MPGTRKTQRETKDSQEKHREREHGNKQRMEYRMREARESGVNREIKQPETLRDKEEINQQPELGFGFGNHIFGIFTHGRGAKCY